MEATTACRLGITSSIQKPLAVVVMGGLITSTLLTLIVLPTLYALFANRFDPVAKAAEI
jgi:cobalt-zinc-cadmium resistance protein CzcA